MCFVRAAELDSESLAPTGAGATDKHGGGEAARRRHISVY